MTVETSFALLAARQEVVPPIPPPGTTLPRKPHATETFLNEWDELMTAASAVLHEATPATPRETVEAARSLYLHLSTLDVQGQVRNRLASFSAL